MKAHIYRKRLKELIKKKEDDKYKNYNDVIRLIRKESDEK